MKIREATTADFPDVMRLYRQLQPDDPVLEDGRDRAVFDTIVESPWLAIHVLELDEGIASTCYFNLIPNITRSARPYAIIENVVTDAAQRNRGLGQALLGAVLEIAWDRGCYKAMLQTGSRRPATHGFYRACGFSDTDKTGYVARPPPSD